MAFTVWRDADRTLRGRWITRASFGLLLIVVGGLVAAGIVFDIPKGMAGEGGWGCLAAAFGAIVGASELVSRYRDEPMRAVGTIAGTAYIAVNGLVSGLTYGLLTRYASGLFPGLADDPLMRAIVAGFGAMAILRSKFFTLRTASGETIAVGPDAAISAFLDAADRGVDRSRASRRLQLVFRQASKVARPADGPGFMEISIAALQNLSAEDKARFVKRIEAVRESGYPPQLKLQAICYELLTLIGERNFFDLMNNLERYIEGTPSPGSTASRVSTGEGAGPEANAAPDASPSVNEGPAPPPTGGPDS